MYNKNTVQTVLKPKLCCARVSHSIVSPFIYEIKAAAAVAVDDVVQTDSEYLWDGDAEVEGIERVLHNRCGSAEIVLRDPKIMQADLHA